MADEEFFDPNLGPSPYGILWHEAGTRAYYMGIDRGVLYLDNAPGVPWNGLVSVEEAPEGGSIEPFYLDGVRRRNDHNLEEFAATITAFAAPREFSVCEGEVELAPGLYLGQQYRESFGMSYRSSIGNDIVGTFAAYEIHLVYGAMVEPVARKHNTVSDEVKPETRTWKIATVPLDVQDHAPSARIRLDSRRVPADRLATIQEILYGTADIPPRLPTIEEVYQILSYVEIPPPDEEIPWIPEEPPEESPEDP